MNPSTLSNIRRPRSRPSSRVEEDRRSQRSRSASGSWGGAFESEEDIANLHHNNQRLHQPDGLSCSFLPIDDIEDEVLRCEERFRRKMAFYFMDPIQKWQARRQTPWKLILQFAKIILVTTQLVIFGNYRYAHTNYYSDTDISFDHFFLKGWDPIREIHAYPPASGIYAIYRQSDFYSYFDYVLQAYVNITMESISPVITDPPFVDFCIQSSPITDLYYLEHKVSRCITIPKSDISWDFSGKEYLKQKNFSVPWSALETMSINFTIKTMTTRHLDPMLGPECYVFGVRITFDNTDHDGQVPVQLSTFPYRDDCRADKKYVLTTTSYLVRVLNVTVIFVSFCSLVLCCRALARAQLLRVEAIHFFRIKYNWTLTYSEQLDFLNVWYILICINDILIISGSIIKHLIETRSSVGDLWDFCSVFLGTGNLLVWIGMLRYLGFFKTYNVLILTLKGAMPNVLRFLFCASFIYLGFVFCGWVVLGPYHFKFKSIMSTSECLFSLINGDDMFATFSSIPKRSHMIWMFTRIYLYIFISLFIYVILSLFIAIIMDTYDIIKEYYKDGWPKRRIHEFYETANYDPASGVFRTQSSSQFRQMFFRFSSVLSSSSLNNSGGSSSQSDRNPIIS